MSQRDDLLKVDESRIMYRGYFPRYQRTSNIQGREDLERRLEEFRQRIATDAGREREMMNDSLAEIGEIGSCSDSSASLDTA
jgi:hypothetical protein